MTSSGVLVCTADGYPPDLQEEAVKTVLAQAELVCGEWELAGNTHRIGDHQNAFRPSILDSPSRESCDENGLIQKTNRSTIVTEETVPVCSGPVPVRPLPPRTKALCVSAFAYRYMTSVALPSSVTNKPTNRRPPCSHSPTNSKRTPGRPQRP